MKLPNEAHTARPWRIHPLTYDYRLEDVWALPDVERKDDFPRLVALLASYDPAESASPLLRALVAIRWKLGKVLRLDADGEPNGPTLRDRLPDDLRRPGSGPAAVALPFRTLYLTEDEWAAEVANRTMHGVLHVGLVPHRDGGHGAQLAILVKPNGLLGAAYMASIKPFRHLVVYPTILSEGAARWRTLTSS